MSPAAHPWLLALVYLSFISLGLPDAVFSVGWPAMRQEWGQNVAAIGLITLTGTISAIVSAQASVSIVRRIGIGWLVALSAFCTGSAMLGIAFAPNFYWAWAMAVPIGFAAGAVDTALNRLVAERYSAKHMNWLHGAWGIGATAGPVLMGAALKQQGTWQTGTFLIVGCIGALAIVLFLTLHWWPAPAAAHSNEAAAAPACAQRERRLQWAAWLAPFLFVLYVAAEMGTGLWAASILSEQRGLPLGQAGLWVSAFFGALTAGRFAAGFIAQRAGNRRLVRYGCALAIAGATLFALPMAPAWAWLCGLVLMGAGCAPIFPSMMHETARRFDPERMVRVMARQTSFAYVGLACAPAAFGLVAKALNLNAIMPVIVVLLIGLLVGAALLDRMTPVSGDLELS